MARMLRSLGFLAIGLGIAAPAAAEEARTSLSVGATVVPACVVATNTAGTASLTCSHLSGGQVEIRRHDAPLTASSREVRPAIAPDPDGVAYVTITY